MNSRLIGCFFAGALALASPALARGGMGGGGGMHGGGMGGWMLGGGGMHFGGMGGGMRVGGIGPATHFGGAHFAGAGIARPGFAPRSSRFSFHDGRFFHHRHNRFFFAGAPYAYAAYESCWRRTWTPYGVQWVNVCGDYNYY